MSFMDDNTSLIRMKRDFDQFLQDQNDSRVSAFSIDRTDTTRTMSGSPDASAMSVKSLLEKERMLRLKEADYLAMRGQLANLQTKITSLETSNKKAKLDHDHHVETLKSERAQESEKLCDLRAKLRFLEDKEARAQEAAQEVRGEAQQQRARFEERILALQREKLQMEDDFEQEKKDSWDKIKELEKSQMRKDADLNICQFELEKTQAQLKLQLKRSSDITGQMKELEEYKLKATEAEQQVKDLELKLSRMEEDHVIAQGLKTQLTTFHDMERENRRLKDDNQYLRDIQENNLLLKEQHDSMKRKLERAEEKLADYSRICLDNEELKGRLERWESADKMGHKIRSPSELSKRVGQLQSSEVIMLQKQGELQSSLSLKENSMKNLQDELASLKNHVQLERAKFQQQTDLVRRMQRKLRLVTSERDGLKHTLEMYESDVTMSLPAGAGAGPQQDRIQQLEETTQAYARNTESLEDELKKMDRELLAARQTIKKLEKRVAENEHSAQNGGPSLQTDKQTILHLREKIADLEKRLEKCEEEKFTLEARIEQRHLQGDYDPTKLKVLAFKMNPTEMAKADQRTELERLRTENARLQQRVKLLEENEGQRMEDLTVAVEARLQEPGSSKDVEEMRAQLMSAERKNERLMEAFRTTSQEMREVCYQLTGYKLDMHVPNRSQHRLTSMFAESPEDYLLFHQGEAGEIEMLGTDFSSTLGDLMDTYLRQRDSIPAFLAAVTLELCSRQTMNFG